MHAGDSSMHNCALPAAIENYLVSPQDSLYSGRVAAPFNRCIPLHGTAERATGISPAYLFPASLFSE